MHANRWQEKRALQFDGHNRRPGEAAAKKAQRNRWVRRKMAEALRRIAEAVRGA